MSDPIWDWQEKMFIYSCWLYEYSDLGTAVSDENFDRHCAFLLIHYDKLSESFRNRVSRDQLQAGTGLGLKFDDEEIEGAIAWKKRVEDIS